MELIVVGFPGKYRAAQVLTELRQRAMHLFNLDQAITVSWEDHRKFIVQQSVNLSREEGSRWARLWGAFIKVTLFQPFTEALGQAAHMVAGRNGNNGSATSVALGRTWWISELGLPVDFIRDVGALVQPGESAIISLADQFEPSTSIGILRVMGGAVVYASMTAQQMNTIKAALATTSE